MSNIALIVNTISKNSDIWEAFFKQLERHVSSDFFHKKYVFVDDDMGLIPKDFKVLKYDKNKLYRSQFLSCVEQVKEKFCIYISEDYILYGDVDEQKINSFSNLLLEDENISFIRFMRGGVYDQEYKQYDKNLFYVHEDKDYFYTNQAALWKTDVLKKIHFEGPELHIANQDWQNSFEYQATKTCRKLNIHGLFCYYEEEKRGTYHYDSIVFPHISTALVKGKWNMSEYPKEMSSIVKQYKINIMKRGWV